MAAKWEWIKSGADAAVETRDRFVLALLVHTWIQFNTCILYTSECNEMSIGFNSWLNYCIICWMSADNNSFARWLPLVTHNIHGWIFSSLLSFGVDNESARWAQWRWKTIQNATETKGKVRSIFCTRSLSPSPSLSRAFHLKEAKTISLDCTFVHLNSFYYYLWRANFRGWVNEIIFFGSASAFTNFALRSACARARDSNNGSHYLISKTFSGNLYTNWFRSCRDRERDATH